MFRFSTVFMCPYTCNLTLSGCTSYKEVCVGTFLLYSDCISLYTNVTYFVFEISAFKSTLFPSTFSFDMKHEVEISWEKVEYFKNWIKSNSSHPQVREMKSVLKIKLVEVWIEVVKLPSSIPGDERLFPWKKASNSWKRTRFWVAGTMLSSPSCMSIHRDLRQEKCTQLHSQAKWAQMNEQGGWLGSLSLCTT